MNESTSTVRPIVALIAKHQQQLQLTDEELSLALGFTSPNVIKMIKNGTLIFPINKVPDLAELFEIDATDTFRAALGEMPEFLAVIELLYPISALSAAERNLIAHLRKIAGDRELHPIVFDGKDVVALVTTT